ncbi:hypothetical protein GGF46_005109 [Coemansia sp. RSA 552]|nr:hypothetical protein GGF46_005109 [Coemansia sp. RSA 552]
MSARYPKVLTRQNAQMFAGGALLALTAGHLWLRSRKERTAELQERLRKVQQHMYWSIPLTQRMDVPFKASSAIGLQSRPRWEAISKVNSWWNSRVAGLGRWAVRPGYLSQQAGKIQTAARQQMAAGWWEARAAVGAGGRWAAGQIADTVRWQAVSTRARDIWAEEKAKWSQAHASAVAAVHPLYAKTSPDSVE